MRRSFVLAVVVVYSVLFFACEEDAIPVPLPPQPPTAQTTDDFELLPPPSDNASSNNTPSNNIASPAPSEMKRMVPSSVEESYEFEESEQLKSGKYTIQVVLFPSEASAKKLVKKMAGNGIRAYYTEVNDPDYLSGTYYRVRVGYFNEIPAATAFAKTRLEPLGYAWWVDNARNDNVPKSGGTSSKPKEALDPELERAKQEYKEIAKAAAKEVIKQQQQPQPTAKAAPPPPPPPAKAKAVVQEKTTGEMEVDNRGKVRIKKKKSK